VSAEADLEIAKAALRRIAADHEISAGGHRKKIARLTMINLAREACERLGWDYSSKGEFPK